MLIAISQHAGGKVRSPPPPFSTYHLNGCKAKGSLGPIWDHLKFLYIERLTAYVWEYLYMGLLSMNKSAEQFCANGRDQALLPIWEWNLCRLQRLHDNLDLTLASLLF